MELVSYLDQNGNHCLQVGHGLKVQCHDLRETVMKKVVYFFQVWNVVVFFKFEMHACKVCVLYY